MNALLYKPLYYNSNCSLANIEYGLYTILNQIKDNSVFVVLIIIEYEGMKYTMTNALYISNEESVKDAIRKLRGEYTRFMMKYGMEGNIGLVIKGRVYLSEDEYVALKDKVIHKKVMKALQNHSTEMLNKMKKTNINNVQILYDKFKDLSNIVSTSVPSTELYLHKFIYKYAAKWNFITISRFIKNNITDTNYSHSCKIDINKEDLTMVWIDDHFKDGTIKRYYKGDVFVFKDEELINIEIVYNFPNLRKPLKDKEINCKIGVIDIETYRDADNKSIPYAAGYKVDNDIVTFYKQEGEEFNTVVIKIMDDLLKKYPHHTFFVHNLDFDGIYLLNALVSIVDNISKIEVIMKDKSFMKISYGSMIILDSYKFIPASLEKILNDFQLPFTKGSIPYDFITKDTVFYIGPDPSESSNKATILNIKEDTIEYLKNDLNSLYAVITKFNSIIYKKYIVDLTKTVSISSLSFKIYLTNFYKAKFNVKLIKGLVDMDIRNSHYGGVVAIKHNIVKDAYYYDMNSQYPSAMLNPMPIGNPTLTMDVDLDNNFGFFYASILVPENELSFIPYRTQFGEILYPNYEFSGWYFSEELKALKALNYRIKLEGGGYKFDSCDSLFKHFVDALYSDRLKAKQNKNKTLANIIKLIMNSLYGKTGMNPISTFTSIIHKDKLLQFDLYHTVIYSFPLPNDMVLVYAYINAKDEIIKLFDKTIDNNAYNKIYKTAAPTGPFYSQTSIPLASAIASYARISMLPFKTIIDNEWYYTDTDSIILKNPLDPQYVSHTQLGKMKLEMKIKEAIFIAPKFYAILLDDDSIVIKSAGIPKNQLYYSDFKNILNGLEKVILTKQFVKQYDTNSIRISDRKIKLSLDQKYKQPIYDEYSIDL